LRRGASARAPGFDGREAIVELAGKRLAPEIDGGERPLADLAFGGGG